VAGRGLSSIVERTQFAAWEEPKLFSTEVRAAFKLVRR